MYRMLNKLSWIDKPKEEINLGVVMDRKVKFIAHAEKIFGKVYTQISKLSKILSRKGGS